MVRNQNSARSVVFALLLVTAASIIPAATHAQAAGDTDTAVARVLMESRSASLFLRIRGVDTVTGRIASLTPDKVQLVGGSMALRDISAVEFRRREGGGGKAGALLGIATVGVVGVAFLKGGRGLGLHGIAGIGVVGIAVGAPVGYMAGRAVSPPKDSWHIVWQR